MSALSWPLSEGDPRGAELLRRRLAENLSSTGRFDAMDALDLFQRERGRLVKLDDGRFYLLDGARYVSLSEDQLSDRLVSWLMLPGSPFRGAWSSDRLDKWRRSIMTAARTCARPGATVPFFQSSGESGAGWTVFQNGRLNVRTAARHLLEGGALPAEPRAFSTIFQPNDGDLVTTSPVVPCEWDPYAECRDFLAWLSEVQPDEAERTMLRHVASYLLSEELDLKAFIVFVGITDTAKSAMARLFAAVLPFPVAWFKKWSVLDDPRELSHFAENGLVIFDDCPGVPTPSQLEVLKGYASGSELVPCRKMYRDTVFLPNRARVLICTNSHDKFRMDEATQGRERAIFFNVQFGHGGLPKRPGIELEIAERERAGILVWMVKGYANLLRATKDGDGNFPNIGFGATIQRDKRAEDPVGEFVRRRFKMTSRSDAFVPLARMRALFDADCIRQGLLDEEGNPIPDEDGEAGFFQPPTAQEFAKSVKIALPQARYAKRTFVGENGVRTSANVFYHVEERTAPPPREGPC